MVVCLLLAVADGFGVHVHATIRVGKAYEMAGRVQEAIELSKILAERHGVALVNVETDYTQTTQPNLFNSTQSLRIQFRVLDPSSSNALTYSADWSP